MGLFNLANNNKTPQVTSILPPIAQNEIMCGRLPVLKTSQIFVKQGECCHYMDNAIYEKETNKRKTVRKNGGYSMPGLIKGTRVFIRNGVSDSYEEKMYEQIPGKLFITNQRIIFVGSGDGFNEKIDDLVAVTPYSNCIELQFSKRSLRVFVPSGNIVSSALQIIK